MNQTCNISSYTIRVLLALGFFVIILTGCSGDKNPLNSSQEDSPFGAIESKSKRNTLRSTLALEISTADLSDDTYPQSATVTIPYMRKGIYKGTGILVDNGTSFSFENGALTPPSDFTWGEPVTITMKAERDPQNNQIIYSFDPHGCVFDPPAELIIDYSDLGSDTATLYYFEDDNKRIEHLPDNVDLFKKQICIYFDHFSRYAIAYSD